MGCLVAMAQGSLLAAKELWKGDGSGGSGHGMAKVDRVHAAPPIHHFQKRMGQKRIRYRGPNLAMHSPGSQPLKGHAQEVNSTQ